MFVAIYFYDVVVALHVAAIVVAFGVTFAYPILETALRKTTPRSMAAWHRAQNLVGQRLISSSGGVALLAGIYLASKRHYWDKIWVQVPLVILVVLLALGGAFFSPSEKKAAELAERDIAAAGDGEPVFSPEYEAISKRIAIVGSLASLSILVAIFFMAAKPGGY